MKDLGQQNGKRYLIDGAAGLYILFSTGSRSYCKMWSNYSSRTYMSIQGRVSIHPFIMK